MLVIDKQVHINKEKEHTCTYIQLTVDPTNKHIAKIINLLMKFKTEGGFDNT